MFRNTCTFWFLVVPRCYNGNCWEGRWTACCLWGRKTKRVVCVFVCVCVCVCLCVCVYMCVYVHMCVVCMYVGGGGGMHACACFNSSKRQVRVQKKKKKKKLAKAYHNSVLKEVEIPDTYVHVLTMKENWIKLIKGKLYSINPSLP